MQNEKLEKLIQKFKGQKTQMKILAVVLLLIVLIILFFVMAYVVGMTYQSIASISGKRVKNPLYYGLTDGLLFTGIIFFAIIAIIVAGIIKVTFRNPIEYIDENGLRRLKITTKGASRFQTADELQAKYVTGDTQKCTDTILGKLSQNGKKDVVFNQKQSSGGAEDVKNELVIASMGSGKTFTFVNNQIMQSTEAGHSFIASDPKGELFEIFAPYCRKRGMDVHILDIKKDELIYSEFWDCMKEVIDPKTERLSSSRLNTFTDTYFRNIDFGEKKPDPYWSKSQQNVLRTAIGYVAWKKESAITKHFRSLYKHVAGVSVNDSTVKEWDDNMISFPEMKREIRKKALENGYSIDEINETIIDIEENSSDYKLTLSEVYNVVLKFKDYVVDMESIPDWYPAYDQFQIYNSGEEKNKEQAVKGCQLNLDLFTNKELKNILSYKGIDLTQVNMRRTAIFVIFPDNADDMKPVSSLFFTFALQDMIDNYDKCKSLQAAGEYDSIPCIGVDVIFEEFYSIGAIPTLPTLVGTIRSRKITLKIIIQYYDQLSMLYDDKTANAVQGACPTIIYLGGNEPSTMKFISYMAGNQTVQSESHHEIGGLSIANTGTDTSVSEAQRPLITEEEARMWKRKNLVIQQREQPFKLFPVPWIEHWVVQTGIIHWVQNGDGKWDVATEDKASVLTWSPSLRERMRVINERKPAIPTKVVDDKEIYQYDDYFRTKINNLKGNNSYVIDEEIGEVIEEPQKSKPSKSNSKPKKAEQHSLFGNPDDSENEQKYGQMSLGEGFGVSDEAGSSQNENASKKASKPAKKANTSRKSGTAKSRKKSNDGGLTL